MRCSKQPPEQTYRYPQKQEDHREGASGAARARSETSSAPPSSKVARTRLPIPPVKTVELALSVAVTPCVRPATPPPAMMAAVHFTIGGKSVMTAADTIVPATNAAGVARASSKLSIPGM